VRLSRLLLFIVIFICIFTIPCSSVLLGQAEWPRPNWEKVEIVRCGNPNGQASSYPISGYEVRLVPAMDNEIHDPACHAYLVERSGKKILLLTGWTVSIHQGTGEDLFGDGHPSLVLEGYSGGAHCCYTYEIVDLGKRPLILRPIKNESPFFFFKDPASKQYRIMTGDGAFDSFDSMCHACAPFPRVVLRADRTGLHDVSAQFVEQYDSEIAFARAKFAPGEMNKFQMGDFKDAKGVLLEIMVSYLYSGREAQAWQILDETWPAADRERIKNLILKTKATGFLSRLASTAPRNTAAYTR
jgi:hypothetical protein